MSNTDICAFCEEEKETILHLFCECKYVLELWNNFFVLLRGKCNINIQMENDILLFGITVNTTESEIVNLCLLIIRQYSHVCRCKKVLPNIGTCINNVLTYKSVRTLCL